MTKPELEHPGYWTEEEYLALGETDNRIELIDGGLWVSPSANMSHQYLSSFLWLQVMTAASTAGLIALEAINVRLRSGRIVLPDLVVTSAEPVGLVADADQIVLVGEITSPSNAAVDRGQKKQFYAAAGIDWYLLVEPDLQQYKTVSLQLSRRDGDHYLEHAAAAYGETLISQLPFPMTIDTEKLVHHR